MKQRLLAKVWLASCVAAAVVVPIDADAQTVVGPRSSGMGEAHRGVANGNDAIFTNPAGMSLFPRYSIEVFWRRNTIKNANQYSVSIVDSRSGAVAGGLAYTYEWVRTGGRKKRIGSRVDIASSYRLTNFLLFGVTMKYLGFTTEDEDVSRVTGDTGFLVQVGRILNIGFTAYNVVNPVDEGLAAPRMIGGGIGLYLFGGLQLAFDYRKKVDKGEERVRYPSSYFVGAEYFVDGAISLRGGYVTDQFADEKRWTLGLGYLDRAMAIDLSYSHTTQKDRVQVLSIGFRLFL